MAINIFEQCAALTVTVLASSSVKMKSPPSKSSLRYRMALKAEWSIVKTVITKPWLHVVPGFYVPIVPVCICWWLFDTLVELGDQETVVNVYRVAQVISVFLFLCTGRRRLYNALNPWLVKLSTFCVFGIQIRAWS